MGGEENGGEGTRVETFFSAFHIYTCVNEAVFGRACARSNSPSTQTKGRKKIPYRGGRSVIGRPRSIYVDVQYMYVVNVRDVGNRCFFFPFLPSSTADRIITNNNILLVGRPGRTFVHKTYPRHVGAARRMVRRISVSYFPRVPCSAEHTYTYKYTRSIYV